ncbi:capsid protein [robinz virus RP_377]|nr:capsid protein [robinz virus RP_377]
MAARRPALRRKRATPRRKTRRHYSGVKKRTYSKKRRATTTRRKILEISSVKKRDHMLSYTNTTINAPNGGATYSVSLPAVLIGGSSPATYVFPWCPTAREAITGGSSDTSGINLSARERDQVYMRGLAEKISVATNSGASWKWRRICFVSKQVDYYGTASSYQQTMLTSNGYVRVVNALSSAKATVLFTTLFKGSQDSDWQDPFIASVDSNMVTPVYDKTVTIASGNDAGVDRVYRKWHPMNKNLYYQGDEAGTANNITAYASPGRRGMGNYFIIDLFRGSPNATAGDSLLFRPEATLYWHER